MSSIKGNWINASATQRVMAVLTAAGGQAYFVGGCVRNDLMDVPVADIDIATDLMPAKVSEVADAAGLKVIPTGIDHGTVTVVADHVPHEITTFRKDVETDGRRAVVSYSTSITDDARRRDFTINALYADAKGEIADPLGGMSDLLARRVRFIEDAAERIREDYLRILRFFRFHAWYGDPAAGIDEQAIAAIADNLEGLDGLSRERVGSELMKLLAASHPAPAVAAMEITGVLNAVLPGSTGKQLGALVHLEDSMHPDPVRRLAILGGQDAAERLRLSRKDVRKLDLYRAEMATADAIDHIGYRCGATAAIDIALLRAASLGGVPDINFDAQAEFGARQTFPISAGDLMPQLQGKLLGDKLKFLEKAWIESGFQLTKADLLNL